MSLIFDQLLFVDVFPANAGAEQNAIKARIKAEIIIVFILLL